MKINRDIRMLAAPNGSISLLVFVSRKLSYEAVLGGRPRAVDIVTAIDLCDVDKVVTMSREAWSDLERVTLAQGTVTEGSRADRVRVIDHIKQDYVECEVCGDAPHHMIDVAAGCGHEVAVCPGHEEYTRAEPCDSCGKEHDKEHAERNPSDYRPEAEAWDHMKDEGHHN